MCGAMVAWMIERSHPIPDLRNVSSLYFFEGVLSCRCWGNFLSRSKLKRGFSSLQASTVSSAERTTTSPVTAPLLPTIFHRHDVLRDRSWNSTWGL